MPTPSSTAGSNRASRAAAHAKITADLADKAAKEKKRLFDEQYAANAPKREAESKAWRNSFDKAHAASRAAEAAAAAEEAAYYSGELTLAYFEGREGDSLKARASYAAYKEFFAAVKKAKEATENAAEKAEAAVEAGNALKKKMSNSKGGGGYTRRGKRKTRRTYKNRR
jgi:hypothetical protein